MFKSKSMINTFQIDVVNDILENHIVDYKSFIERRVRSTYKEIENENERILFENNKYNKIFIIEHPQHGLSFIKDFDRLINLLLENNLISIEKASKDIHDSYLICIRSNNNLIPISDMSKIRNKYFDKEIIFDHLLIKFKNDNYKTGEYKSNIRNQNITKWTGILTVIILAMTFFYTIYSDCNSKNNIKKPTEKAIELKNNNASGK